MPAIAAPQMPLALPSPTRDPEEPKFYDADFFADTRRSESITKDLHERHAGLRWAASINPRDVLRAERSSPGFLARLRRTGCTRLLMGVESGNDRVLRQVVDKMITRDEAFQVMADIAAAGIIGAYTFIVGFPGESSVEIEDTFSLVEAAARLTPRPDTRVHIYAPYPGTPLYAAAIQAGFAPPASLEGWSDFDYYSQTTPWVDDRLIARARNATHQNAMTHKETSLQPH